MKPMLSRSRFILSASLALAAGLASAQYSVQVLDFDGYDINVKGQVVGSSTGLDGNLHAYSWQGGVTTELAPGSASSEAYQINAHGQIVGLNDFGSGHTTAALWSAGVATDLGTLGGLSSFANDITDAGLVVGASYAEHGMHAFTWTASEGLVDYGSEDPESNMYYAGFNAVNSKGLLAGVSYRLFSPYHAAVGQVGQKGVVDIAGPGQFSTSMALAVNEAGTIVGYANPGRGAPHAAILHTDGTYEDLGSFGLSDSWANDINDAGDIVGQAFGDDGSGGWVSRAFIYRNGTMTALDTLTPTATGWSAFTDARGINALGQIVGTGIYNGEIKGFVMTPVPEPASMAALGLGALALLRRRRA